MNWFSVGALCGFVGVLLGAFGAHGLKRIATPEQLAWWSTATQYLLVHALALLAVGWLQTQRPDSGLPGTAFLVGSVLFSGTLYAMGLGAPRWFGAITPLGGLALLLGWASLAWQARTLN
jgi:uncharacterized membrane protein YgdD (TMEM256/DUF423 family)